MQSFALVALSVASIASSASARTMTVKNNCAYTVWPALFTDMNAGTVKPDQKTGWEAAPQSSVNFAIPDKWTAGRIWGRRDCNFSNGNGATACVTGSCNGGLECDPSTGTGVPPATLAEFTLNGDGNQDFYDVSLVDGFNIPMSITSDNSGCKEASCPKDLNPDCPEEIAGPSGPSGNEGCKSACEANLDGNPSDSGNCCSGSHNTPQTCPTSGVQFYDYFKSGCPNSYAYAYDENSGSALFKCDGGPGPSYTVTFCP